MRVISGDFETISTTQQSGKVVIHYQNDLVNHIDLYNESVVNGRMGDVRMADDSGDTTPRNFRGTPTWLVNILDYKTEDKTTGGYEWETIRVRGRAYRDRLEVEWVTAGSNLKILKIGFFVAGSI